MLFPMIAMNSIPPNKIVHKAFCSTEISYGRTGGDFKQSLMKSLQRNKQNYIKKWCFSAHVFPFLLFSHVLSSVLKVRVWNWWKETARHTSYKMKINEGLGIGDTRRVEVFLGYNELTVQNHFDYLLLRSTMSTWNSHSSKSNFRWCDWRRL